MKQVQNKQIKTNQNFIIINTKPLQNNPVGDLNSPISLESQSK